MKKEARLLLDKSLDSLVLAIEMFNRPSETGRKVATLILLDHSFEMLLKAIIVAKGGSIRSNIKGVGETISIKTATNRLTGDPKVKCLVEDQAAVVRSINALRDAAQHHLLEISEHLLFLEVQAAITLYRDLLRDALDLDVAKFLPNRVLPISSTLPKDIVAVFQDEVGEIANLLQPGRRRTLEAQARMRTLVIVERAFSDSMGLPSDSELRKLARSARNGNSLDAMFPRIASTETSITGEGLLIELRITKREGVAIHYASENETGLPVIGRKIAETDFYCFSSRDLAKKLGLPERHVHALVHHLRIKEDIDCFKAIKLYSSPTPRYSQKAVGTIKHNLTMHGIIDAAVKEYNESLALGRARKTKK